MSLGFDPVWCVLDGRGSHDVSDRKKEIGGKTCEGMFYNGRLPGSQLRPSEEWFPDMIE